MMLSPKGEKLSKRHAAVSVSEYRDKGYTPEAVLNYLVRFGWSAGDREIFSRADLVELFGWDHVGKSDGKFDDKKFSDVAFEHLKQPELTSDEDYLRLVVPFLERAGIEKPDPVRLAGALPLIRERARDLADAAQHLDFYFREPPTFDDKAKAKFLTPAAGSALADLSVRLAKIADWTATSLEAEVLAYVNDSGVEMKTVAQPLRVALTGRSASPGLYDVLVVLGRELSLARLAAAVRICQTEL
jgi:glutamyl-tRNA synthetase